ncbi:MAG: hypothetical protein IJ242_00410 [Clostridia bacterium]|nr:hypothetical protein [Clostridia bacterium]
MASGTSDLIVRLSLDTTQFEGFLSKFEGQMTKLQASCTNAATGITNFKQVQDKERPTGHTGRRSCCGQAHFPDVPGWGFMLHYR